MKSLVTVVVLSLAVMMLVAQDSPSPASKVVTSVMEEFDKAKTDADQKYEKAPAVVNLQTVRLKAIERASKTATTKLEKLMADSKKEGSDLGVESAKQGIEDVAAAVQNANLTAMGLDKLVVKFKGRSYLVVLKPVTWSDADKLCKDMGGHLAYIKNSDIMGFIIKSYPHCPFLWVGGKTPKADKDRNKWRWLDGTPIDPSLWREGNPDNWNGNETCGLIAGKDNLWDLPDKKVNEIDGFVCEWGN